MPPPTTDIELLNQHRGGSESAFADLVQRHLGWVYGVARRRVRDAHLADDVAQAVFILLHRKAPQFAADGAMIRWLYKTAWYASESAARSERRRVGREMHYAIEHPEAVNPAEPPEWKELAPALDRLISKLSRTDREAILLRYYRDLPLAEVAQQIGATPEAARKRIERAVERLRGLAAQQGMALSSASLALGLSQFVRVAPPPGLVATSTVAATASSGSALAGASASIAKGAITMMASTKIAIASIAVLGCVLTAATICGSIWIFSGNSAQATAPAPAAAPPAAPSNLVLATVGQLAPQSNTTYAADNKFLKAAPFSAIRWNGDVPQIELKGTWYELVGIDGLTVTQIHASQDARNDPNWQKHFGEDLVEVLTAMNHKPGKTVDLQVRTLDGSAAQKTLTAVPMTEENRRSLIEYPAGGQP